MDHRITVTPAVSVAGAWGTWRLRFTIGAGGIAPGGGLRVQLPNTWHAWMRNSAKGVHTEDPSAANYVTARAFRTDAGVKCLVEEGTTQEFVKTNRIGLDGRPGRYVYVVTAQAVDELREYDTLEVVFGDCSAGSPGFIAALHPEGAEVVRVALDADGSGAFTLFPVEASPTLEVMNGPLAEVVVVAPSILGVDEETELTVVLLDRFANRVENYVGTASLRRVDGVVEIADSVDFTAADRGRKKIPFTVVEPGVARVEVQVGGVLDGLSNPVDCRREAPVDRLWWGDIHSHADASFDGVGHHPFEYARDVSVLDFHCLTDHAERWPDGRWEQLRELVKAHHESGAFVTLLGYEATFGAPWGHHNVYFREDDGVVSGSNVGDLHDLWKALAGRQALTIPHHTGVGFSPQNEGHLPGGSSPTVDWEHHDAHFRRLVEIYSGHGLCERYDPSHPLSYENSDFSINVSVPGPHYVWDGWARGQQLGVVAASDNHRGTPGRGELGLAAVYAPELTREAVFDALLARATYATTGARILLQFSVDGVAMGERQKSSIRGVASVRVHGTGTLETVEILRGDMADGGIAVAHTWHPAARDFEGVWTDPTPPSQGFYYARVRQAEPYRGRPPMAWSSPVWIGQGP